jgi:hypothetical protein
LENHLKDLSEAINSSEVHEADVVSCNRFEDL